MNIQLLLEIYILGAVLTYGAAVMDLMDTSVPPWKMMPLLAAFAAVFWPFILTKKVYDL